MLRLRFLGPPEVCDGDRPVAVAGAKAWRVLAALAAQPGRVAGMEALVRAVWSGDEPPTARKQIRNTVSSLRDTAIGSLLKTQGTGYLLEVARDRVDVSEFEDLLHAAERHAHSGDLAVTAATLRQALDLWRGPAFADIGGGYFEALAAGLEERRWSALTRWARASVQLGKHAKVVDELAAAVAQQPMREPLAGALMLALYRCGRGGEAIACYHRTRQALAGQLGVEPGPELRRLFERVLVDDPALGQPEGAPRRNFLPRDLPAFLGRSGELHRLTKALAASAMPIQAVDGMAGVGKTTLAVHAAHELADRFDDGQLFLDLHGHTPDREPVGVAEALEELLRCIGIPEAQIPPGEERRAALWRSESAGRRLLVVLDNASGSGQVRPLLPGSATCAVLITSRRRLVGLDGAEVLSLDPLPHADAVAMFRRIAGADRTTDDGLVLETVRLCGFLPLAVSIAAARLRSRPNWTMEHLLHGLADERSRPSLLEADGYGVAAAFSLSYRHLDPEQQRLYRLLGLHPGTMLDRYHAAALAAIPAGRAERILEELCDYHLLIPDSPGRYRFHDLVHEHARSAARSEPQRRQALERLLDYYLRVSEAAAEFISPSWRRLGPPPGHPQGDAPRLGSLADAIAWHDAERPNLLPLVRLAADHGDRGWQIPKSIGAYLLRRGHLIVGVSVMRAAVAATERPGVDRRARAECLSALGAMWRGLGDHQAALECMHECLEHTTSTGDRHGETETLTVIADIHLWLGSYEAVVDITSYVIDIFRAEGSPRSELSALASHIQALMCLGRHAEAFKAAGHAAQMLPNLDTGMLTGGLLGRLGTAYSSAGAHALAKDLLKQAVTAAKSTGYRVTEAEDLNRLAHALHIAGDPGLAREYALEALDILTDTPELAGNVETHITLGDIHFGQARYHEALAHYRQAASAANLSGYTIGYGRALDGVGKTLERLEDPEGARHNRARARGILGGVTSER